MDKKLCSSCDTYKNVSEFSPASRNTDGYKGQCRKCVNAKDEIRRLANPTKHAHNQRKARLKSSFGLTIEQYELMFASQGGVCAICKRPPMKRRLDIDHCHRTGQIRGLLCWTCNYTLLASGRRDAAVFRAAADYLENPPAVSAVGEIVAPKRKPKQRRKNV